MRPALLLGPLVLFPTLACDDDDDDDGGFVGTVFELEPNDDPATANYLGGLAVGSQLVIEGFITDRGTDPFDGFAFTALEPLHVDVLLAHNTLSDLDVCLFDPQLNQTLACFATEDNPELGGVDITAAGLDFHLVVESFVGESEYALELVVLPLFAARALEAGQATRAIVPTGARIAPGRWPAAPHGYVRPLEDPLARGLEIERRIQIDRRTGLVLELVRVLRGPGFQEL